MSTLKLTMDDDTQTLFNQADSITAKVYKNGELTSIDTMLAKDKKYAIIDLHQVLKIINDISPKSTEPITSSDTIKIELKAKLADSMFENGKLRDGIKLRQTLNLAKADYGKDLIEKRTITLSSKEDGTTIDSYEEIPEGSGPIQIGNNKTVLPFTGSAGVWIGFAILGVILMTLAGIYLAMKGKEKKTI